MSDFDVRDPVMMADVLEGLSRPQKALEPKYFYDARGSALFVEITRLPEYYATRTEVALLDAVADSIAAHAADVECVIEYGSGDGRKSVRLLQALPAVDTYVPVEISIDAVRGQAALMARQLPRVRVEPVVADFTRPFVVPDAARRQRRMGFFPGSTIGNLSPLAANDLLRAAGDMLGRGALFLVGVDLKKPVARLLAAYDDAAGVTAAFNLNLLTRLNRELGANFDLTQFAHRVRYNDDAGRIEMHLESLVDQIVVINGRPIRFAAGETIHTENSHKFTTAEARLMARSAGWEPLQVYSDPEGLFALMLLVNG